MHHYAAQRRKSGMTISTLGQFHAAPTLTRNDRTPSRLHLPLHCDVAAQKKKRNSRLSPPTLPSVLRACSPHTRQRPRTPCTHAQLPSPTPFLPLVHSSCSLASRYQSAFPSLPRPTVALRVRRISHATHTPLRSATIIENTVPLTHFVSGTSQSASSGSCVLPLFFLFFPCLPPSPPCSACSPPSPFFALVVAHTRGS